MAFVDSGRQLRRWGPRAALFASAAAAVVVCAPSEAQAQPAVTRRFNRLVQQAQEAYGRGDADQAVNFLEQAYTLRPVPLLLFNIGRSQELAGRLERAVEYYDRYLATNPEAEQRSEAERARGAARAELDARRARAAAAGGGSVAVSNTSARATPTTRIRWVERPRTFNAGHGTLIFGGSAVAIAGGIFGGLALGASGQFQETNDPAMRAGLQDRGYAFAWGSNVGIGVGVVAAVIGTILYFVQPTRVAVEEPIPEAEREREASRER